MSEPKVDDAPRSAAEGEPRPTAGDQGAQVESAAQAKAAGDDKASQKKDEPAAQAKPDRDRKKEERKEEKAAQKDEPAKQEQTQPPPVQVQAGSPQAVLMQALVSAQRALLREATAQPVLMVLESAREEATQEQDLSSGTRRRLTMTLEAARHNPSLPQEAQTALAAVAVALRGI